MLIIGNQFIIRNWQAADADSLAKQADNVKIWKNLRDYFPHPYRYSDAVHWIQFSNAKKPISDFAIEVEGKAVGGISIIFQEDVYKKTAEIGYWLGENYWGRGIMTEAVRKLSEYIFFHFEVIRIFAKVFETNPASMKVLEKAGFELEAKLKKNIFKNGEAMDEIIFSLLK